MTIENSHKGKKYSYITIDYQFILQLIFCKILLPFPRIIVCMLFGMKCIKFLTKFIDISLHCSRRASSRYFFGFIWCFVILFPNSHYMCSSFKLDDYGRIGNVWGALYQQSLTYINIYS